MTGTPGTIRVTMKVPFPSLEDFKGGTLVFSHWLPLDAADALSVTVDEQCAVRLWFDIEAAWWASSPSREELAKYVNVKAHYIRVEAQTGGVDTELLDHIRRGSPAGADEGLLSRYWTIGETVHRGALEAVNRLISYARATKGQYWLRAFPIDAGVMSSDFVRFHAEVWLGTEGPFEWRPSRSHHGTIHLQDEKRFVTKEEWPVVAAFLQAATRTPLVGELLSNAEDLLSRGYGRSALVEAVAALEVALNRVPEAGTITSKWNERFGGRLTTTGFDAHVEHLGISATVKYLLPVLMDESASETLKVVASAVEERHTIVHQGQRSVDLTRARQHVRAIRALCEELV